jgi:hypothetical protein
MSTNAKFYTLMLLGNTVMTISGERLGFKVGAAWEFAGLAFGILITVGAYNFRLRERITRLEERMADLIDAGNDQSRI